MFSSKDDNFLHSIQPLFTKWYLEDPIGEGSSGIVYKITDNNGSYCALKVIPVTLDDGIPSLSLKKTDPSYYKDCLDEITNDILSEVKLIQALKNHNGIIQYQEYDIVEVPDSYVRYILIKMELLNPLNKILRVREAEFTKQETVRMGIDLLTALSTCQAQNIVHRDIKPSNIFVTDDNHYLLGDFGNARLLEKTMTASHKGTLSYMAPEIAAGQRFNATVDIYSLGLVMYQLLNNRRLPFLGSDFKFADIEHAIEKRLSGALLPYPENADNELGSIICKMCAYSSKDRYTSPKECLTDLEKYLNHNKVKRKTGKKWKTAIGGVFLLFMLLLAGRYAFFNHSETSAPCITSGNSNASGAIASDNKWLYYSQSVPGQLGIRVSKEDGRKEFLCNYIMHGINITKDYVVFTSHYTPAKSDNVSSSDYITGLYRMNKDGSNLTCLDDSTVYNPVVYNEYIYYLRNVDNSNMLCRIPIDGGQVETFSKFDAFTFHFYIFENELYIYDGESRQLVTFNLHSKKRTVLLNQTGYVDFCIEDGVLYFQVCDKEVFSKKLYIYTLNDSTPTAINPDNCKTITFPQRIYEFNVDNGIIYASSNMTASRYENSEDDGIWRVNRDGSGLKQIYTGNAIQLQIIDKTLYFEDYSQIYDMDLDGSNLQKFDDIDFFYILD